MNAPIVSHSITVVGRTEHEHSEALSIVCHLIPVVFHLVTADDVVQLIVVEELPGDIRPKPKQRKVLSYLILIKDLSA